MSRLVMFLLFILTPAVASAEIVIESPQSGEAVSTPFLVEGHAEPGEPLELVVKDRVVLVFRANAQGAFRIPVDLPATSFAIRSKRDPTMVASLDVVTGGKALERKTRTETANVDAQIGPIDVFDEPTGTVAAADGPEATTAPVEDVEDVENVDGGTRQVAPRVVDPDAAAEVERLNAQPLASADDVVEQLVPDEPAPAAPAEATNPSTDEIVAVPEESVVPQIVPELGSPDNQLVLEQTNPPQPRRWKRWHVGTMLTQIPAGVLGGGLGALGGVYSGIYVVEPITNPHNDFFGAGVIIPTVVGFTAATGFAVWAIGKAWGGKSPWWASMLGSVVGTTASLALPPLFLGFPAATSTVAYHLAARP